MPNGDVALLARDVGPGDHVCAMFDHASDHRAFVDEYVRHGSAAGDRVLLVADDGVRVHDGPRGLSELSEVSGLLLAAGAGLRDTIDLLQRERQRARADGFRALRVVGEMTWLWGSTGRPDELVDFEQALDDELADAGDALVTCLYDRRRFPEELLARLTSAHHATLDLTERSGRHGSEFRAVPGAAPGSLVLEGQCDLATEDALRDAIAATRAAHEGCLVVDLGSLSFASAASLRALCAPALEGGHVVLARPSPLVGEMLDLLGFTDLRGVHVSSVPLDADARPLRTALAGGQPDGPDLGGPGEGPGPDQGPGPDGPLAPPEATDA